MEPASPEPEVDWMHSIDVAVFDEHEIFRRGVVACLDADPLLNLVDQGAVPSAVTPDVAVVSTSVAAAGGLDCPMVVCSGWADDGSVVEDDRLYAVLARNTVSPDQLVSAVRAAAVGLHVQRAPLPAGVLDKRSLEVLQLLAEGAATREISERMGYSERTIKGIIRDIHVGLGARTRAHAVATALRERLI
jgi:DNA-binding NarL/FixJ family response regulator